ncbi:hypothetical protein GCM10011514_12840 [Emticicia aquatilis]|uniref:T9SS C-terminal target domain-containing protein n=1 Tax=Emticicia aquatilis TaxID=1537369 RepID=A0A917DMN7_9BACT|nr:sialate O-acetylesterase [Emticicia aquatilis]GGD50073.1 hypothetical protein GCM10011514_12840 [Emticicia aquatilis]
MIPKLNITKHQVLKTSHRSILLGVLFLFISINSASQILVFFDKFPKDGQLFQRDDFNKATATIEGKVYTEGQTDISLVVYKNKIPFIYKKQKLQYTNQPLSAAFSFSPIIDAELSEYEFKVYSFHNKDSVLVKGANEVVCGDNIIIYGQSNALANPTDELPRFKDEFKFGRSTYADFTKNEFMWVVTRQWNHWSAGFLGLEIQRQLIDKYKIPIGILNGSEGNKSIEELSIRDEVSHDNPSTIYGRLVKRSKAFDIDKNVRIIVWRQGESEALDPFYKNDYDKKFEKFRKQLYEDFPNLKKIYTYQNNIYFGNNPSAGNLREYQRTIKNKYNDCEVVSTFGTVTFDGLHYKLEGYQQNGSDVARLIARDFLNSKDTVEILSPNIKSAYFTAKKDSLILEFDLNQKMSFPKDEPKKDISHPSINVKDYIYLDGKAGNIESGNGVDNYIVLKLKTPSDAKKITYIPDNYTNDFIAVLPGITQIKNSRGLMALTFKDLPITNINNAPTPTLNGEWDTSTYKRVILHWQVPKFLNCTYVIEKAQNHPNIFYEIGTVNGTTFADNKVKKGVKYFYRIRIKEDNTYSPYSNITEVSYQLPTENQAVEITNEDILVYPNPIAKNSLLNFEPLFDTPVIHLRIINALGKLIYDKLNSGYVQTITIPTNDLAEGQYIIEAILEDNTKLIKKFVVQ